MQKPILVVLAAGMGSRYGGMKQLDPVGPAGQLIIDYSIYDARRAGFEKVIFIIRKEKRSRLPRRHRGPAVPPDGGGLRFPGPGGPARPLYRPGRADQALWHRQAVLSARSLIEGPFAVINSDDYYGPQAFQAVYDHLSTHTDGARYQYCMVGYQLQNTVTENGSVSRGMCQVGPDGMLQSVTERTRIVQRDGLIQYADGDSWVTLPGSTTVSMGLWGLGASFLAEAEARFSRFLAEELPQNPLKCEYFLPSVISQLIARTRPSSRYCTAPTSGTASPTGKISPEWWPPWPPSPGRASTPPNSDPKPKGLVAKRAKKDRQ